VREGFRRFSQWTSHATGTPYAFVLALLVIVVWMVTGPLFGFSDTWQLVINTGTTIVTFLMVFILQNTQDRDNTAMQLKLDELLRALRKARTELVDIEELPDDELQDLEKEFRTMHERAKAVREARAGKAPGGEQA
jgi:low affinity Fe/Cu permease